MTELSRKVYGASLGYHGNIALKQNRITIPTFTISLVQEHLEQHIVAYFTHIYCT